MRLSGRCDITNRLDDVECLKLAYDVARRSQDRSTQNGAILVPVHPLLPPTQGCNDLHRSFTRAPERLDRPLKYAWTEHAERAAIYSAARIGIATEGATLYVCWFACADCARAIVFSGIRRVVGHRHPAMTARDDWAESVAIGDAMLAEAGVQFERLDVRLGVTVRFGGFEIEV